MLDRYRNNKTVQVALLVLAIFIFKLVTLASFNDVDWEPDSYMHFLELRTVFADFPNNVLLGLGVWSKPLYTYPLGLIVSIFKIQSLFWIELINIGIFLVIAVLVYKMVVKLYANHAVGIVALVLTSFSLTLFKSSTSTLTDGIFTLTLVLAFYFVLHRTYYFASLMFGLSVLGRIEGLFFVALYGFWLWWFKLRNPKIILHFFLVVSPVLVWNFLGYLHTGLPLYILQGGYPTQPGTYGFGSIFAYPKMFVLKEPLLVLIFVVACILIIRFMKQLAYKKELLLIGMFSIGFIIVQAVFWKFGLFGTAGLMRYFVSIIPFMIIIGVVVFKFLPLRRGFLFGTFGAVSIQLIYTFFSLTGFLIFPQEVPKVDFELLQAGRWVAQNYQADTFVCSERPEPLYYAGRDLTKSSIFCGDYLNNSTQGIYIWSNWGKLNYEDLTARGEERIAFGSTRIFVID